MNWLQNVRFIISEKELLKLKTATREIHLKIYEFSSSIPLAKSFPFLFFFISSATQSFSPYKVQTHTSLICVCMIFLIFHERGSLSSYKMITRRKLSWIYLYDFKPRREEIVFFYMLPPTLIALDYHNILPSHNSLSKPIFSPIFLITIFFFFSV